MKTRSFLIFLLAICAVTGFSSDTLTVDATKARRGYVCQPIDYAPGVPVTTTCGASCTGTCYRRVAGTYLTKVCEKSFAASVCEESTMDVRWNCQTSGCMGNGVGGCECNGTWTSAETQTFQLPYCN